MSDDNETTRRYEAYQESIPRFDNWHTAECLGFFGYATGRAMAVGHEMAQAAGRPMEAACTVCPQKQPCWELLKIKAGIVMPETVAQFEKMATKHQGAELISAWQKLTHKAGQPANAYTPDPYMGINLTNTRVGAEHAAFKDRPGEGEGSTG